jgi:hypothetical protein
MKVVTAGYSMPEGRFRGRVQALVASPWKWVPRMARVFTSFAPRGFISTSQRRAGRTRKIQCRAYRSSITMFPLDGAKSFFHELMLSFRVLA